MRKLILAIAIILIIVGCSERMPDNRIAEASRVVDYFPDSAMICLQGLTREDIRSRCDKAAYSLIYTLASLKLGVDSLDEAALKPAWDYYAGKEEPSREKMLTHFAKAALLSKTGNNIEALTEYEKTIRYASGKNADRYRALAYFNMSTIYNEACLYLDEKECIEEGKKYMLAANDTSTIIHGYLVSGMSYNCVGCHKKAMEELGNALAFAVQNRDNQMADNVRLQIAYTNSLLKNYSAALETFDSLIHYSDCQLSEVDIYTYVNSLSFSGKTEKAEGILNLLDSAFIASTKPYWIFSHSVIAAEKGNYREAYELLDGTLDYQNSFVNDKLNASLVREQKKLAVANEKMQTHLAENRKRMLILVASWGILAAVAGVILIAFIIKRHKLKLVEASYLHEFQLSEMKSRITELTVKIRETERANAVIASNLADVEKLLADNEEEKLSLSNERDELRGKIDVYNRTVVSLRQQLISNFKQLHNDIAHFCNNMPAGISTPSAIKVYEAERGKMLAKYRDGSILALLEEQINELMNKILAHLRDTGLFSGEEFKILIYDFCGFNYKSMADILSITHNNMAVKRNRLKKKVISNIGDSDLAVLKNNSSLLGR